MMPLSSPSSFPDNILKAENISQSYQGKQVIDHVSFEVKTGEVVGLLGPNGAGKTTSFYIVVGLIHPESGNIFLNEQNLTYLPMSRRAQRGVGYLPQEASIFRRMSAQENILSVLETLPLTSSQRKERLEELLTQFRLHSFAHHKGYTLSGGERRRVEVARALALNPRFLLLDEPFAGIDPIAISDIQKMIQLLKTKGIGILITDHNVRETLEICDLAYLLADGKIIESGTPQKLVKSQIARRIYLGENFEI